MTEEGPRLRLVHTDVSDKGGSLMWSEGRLIPEEDADARATARQGLQELSATPRFRRTWGGATWTRSGSSLSVETLLDQHDDLGRPLACTLLFDRLPRRGGVSLPADQVLTLLAEHNYSVNQGRLRRTLWLAGRDWGIGLIPFTAAAGFGALTAWRVQRYLKFRTRKTDQ